MVNLTMLATHFNESVRVPKTELVEKLHNSYPFPFTVEFTKQDGNNRVLRGIIAEANNEFGRTLAADLDLTQDLNHPALRQIDNRTISSLIVKGVKYHV